VRKIASTLCHVQAPRKAILHTLQSRGRPGTQMPAWLDGAYTTIPCYGPKASLTSRSLSLVVSVR